MPRALWGIWERGTIGLLSRDLASPFLRDVWTEERKQRLVEYFTKTNLHSHNFYAIRFFVCEILNFLNSVGTSFLRVSSAKVLKDILKDSPSIDRRIVTPKAENCAEINENN